MPDSEEVGPGYILHNLAAAVAAGRRHRSRNPGPDSGRNNRGSTW